MAQRIILRQTLDDLLSYIHDRLGFRFNSENKRKYEFKLRKMQLPAHWPDLASFRSALLTGDSAAHDLLVRTITVNHTYFFREPAQFTALSSQIRQGGFLNPQIWCAASSTGEEAYSIVIHLLEQGIQKFKVVASDINPKVLHSMNLGVFHINRLEHVTPVQLQNNFQREDEFHWRINPSLRKYVALKRVNLLDLPRFIRPFDFIFCRNVFIYFDETTRNNAICTFHDNLRIGGFLYLGLTEALFETPAGFVMEDHACYRRIADI